MNIVAATLTLTVQGPSVLHSGRLERITTNSGSLPSLSATPPTFTAKATTNIVPERHQFLTNTTSTAQKAQNESTSSAVQNEDKGSFKQLQAADAVERILDQLSTGKLLSWIDGNLSEKIQAQLTDQQRASRQVVADIPTITAQSMATSFGLDDSTALLGRVARSGILQDAAQATADLVPAQVDLSI